jgi:hypothetical protein
MELFNSRVIKSASNPAGVDMNDVDNTSATAIIATNEACEVLNARKAECVLKGALVVCAAHDSTSDEISLAECQQLLHLNVTAIKSTQALPGFIVLAEGMPVILCVRNLSTDLGITNGSQGVVKKIFTSICPAGFTYATCVLVEFPNSRVELSYLPKTIFPIVPSTWAFTTLIGGEGNSLQRKIQVTCRQLPIQPAFAVTGHSSQGKTLP